MVTGQLLPRGKILYKQKIRDQTNNNSFFLHILNLRNSKIFDMAFSDRLGAWYPIFGYLKYKAKIWDKFIVFWTFYIIYIRSEYHSLNCVTGHRVCWHGWQTGEVFDPVTGRDLRQQFTEWHGRALCIAVCSYYIVLYFTHNSDLLTKMMRSCVCQTQKLRSTQ